MRVEEYERERRQCPDCGNQIDECSDPLKEWHPYRRICWATVERETAIAMMKHVRGGEDANFHDGTFTRWAKQWSPEFLVPAGAGETVGVSPVETPDDPFTTQADARPLGLPEPQ